jgi:hypothetical protein
VSTPTHGDNAPQEVDPTGVRALLSSLPDPGPMPDELVARITRSLHEEQERRANGGSGTDHHDVISVVTERHRRRPGRILSMLGAAAAVAVGATVVSAQLFGGDTSNDVSAQYPAGDRADDGSADDSAAEGPAAEEPVPEQAGDEEANDAGQDDGDSSADPDRGETAGTDESDDQGAVGPQSPTDQQVTVHSGRPELTTEDFAREMRAWRQDAATEDIADISSAQARRCAELVGLGDKDSITVGTGSLEGAGVVLLVRSEPRPEQAWAVEPECLEGSGEVVLGPVGLE